MLLDRYLEVSASKIAFHYSALGKPALLHPASTELHFNASHSGDYAVFAITRAGETGVDIERVRKDMARRDEIASAISHRRTKGFVSAARIRTCWRILYAMGSEGGVRQSARHRPLLGVGSI